MSVKFSIIIPTYNRAHLLHNAIESVIHQSYQDWELIIVDDGSKDNTQELVDSYAEKEVRIKYFYQENKERSAARNLGIENSSGEWICFLDSDDVYFSNHLECLHESVMQFNHVKFFITGIVIKKVGLDVKRPFLNFSNKNRINVVAQKFILMNTVCISKSILEEFRFDERFSIWEDTQLWLRILMENEIYQIQEYTCQQSIHEESSVVKGMEKVSLRKVVEYINAIKSLEGFQKITKEIDLRAYIDAKLKMYLYQARQNKQLVVACQIWGLAGKNKFSKELVFELPKIFLNKIGVGLRNE